MAVLLISLTTMLCAQQLEFKTITPDTRIPKELLKNPRMRMVDIQIIDTVDNYLLCIKPVFISTTRTYFYTEAFLLDKNLQTVKNLNTPKEYTKFTPVFLCKLGNNYFFKLQKGYKQYALALYDMHMNFIKAEPMANFGLVCKDDNYIYLQNAPVKAKVPAAYEGELIKMDKDMNCIVRKPVTVHWEGGDNFRQKYCGVDTMGHLIFYNRGTCMAIDKETLEQTKLDLTCPIPFALRNNSAFREFSLYEADKIINFTAYTDGFSGYSLTIHISDYKGKLLKKTDLHFDRALAEGLLDYKNDRLYLYINEGQSFLVKEYDLFNETAKVVSSVQLEKNPGYTVITKGEQFAMQYDKLYGFTVNPFKYDDNSYNLMVSTSVTDNTTSNTNLIYNKYVSYIHMDENFNLIKMDEEVYEKLWSLSNISYTPLHTSDDYTLLMQTKQIKNSYDSEAQFIIWDKSGKQALFAHEIQYRTIYGDGMPNKPIVCKISPTKYYILTALNKENYTLLEMTVKP